jgi:uncharacterized protein (PEP-CTERM system associated)
VSITQQVFSAFAPQASLATENINPNRAETLTYQLSPYIRGKLGANADYVLRYSFTGSKVRGGDVGETRVEDWLGTITGRPAPIGLEWALTGSYQLAHPDVGRDASSRRLYGSVGYRFDPQVRVSGRVGWESTNYATANSESAVTYGAQLEWAPTDRTRFNALAERRPLTNTYEVGLQHRTRLTAWRYSNSKTITTLPAQLVLGRTGTAFDLLFDALTGQFPDPIARTQEVNRLLQQSGIPRDLTLAPLFLSSTVLVQRAHQGSLAILGVRNTVTVAGSIIESRSAETGVPVSSDISRASDIEQRTLTASWAHQLSAITSVTLTGSHTRSLATGVDSPESKEFTARVVLSHQFSPRTYGSLGARYIRFDSSTPGADVREKAITGSLAVTFY